MSGEWRYARRAISVRVTEVRTDLSRWYDGEWVWVRGDELGAGGEAARTIDILVKCAAIHDDEAEGFQP